MDMVKSASRSDILLCTDFHAVIQPSAWPSTVRSDILHPTRASSVELERDADFMAISETQRRNEEEAVRLQLIIGSARNEVLSLTEFHQICLGRARKAQPGTTWVSKQQSPKRYVTQHDDTPS